MPKPQQFAPTYPFELGLAFNRTGFERDAQYAKILLEHFQSITPENELKMCHLWPSVGDLDVSRAESIVQFADQQGLRVRGHTLIWHRCIPAGLELVAPGKAGEDVAAYIAAVLGRYPSVEIWDVINEPFNADGSLRQSFWLALLGPRYIEGTLQAVRRQNPKIKLFINEIVAEEIGPKSDALYALVRDFLERRIPLDGVGFQVHGLHKTREGIAWFDMESFRRNLERFAALGLEIHLTEIDLPIDQLPGDLPLEERYELQAQTMREIMALCRSVPQCTSATLWGLSDRDTWYRYFARPDAMAHPFDAEYVPKPMWRGLIEGDWR